MPCSCDLAITNIRQLVTCEPALSNSDDPEARTIGVIDRAAIATSGGEVAWVGSARDFEASGAAPAAVLDGSRMVVLPGFVDSHTHTVFAGTREREYEARIKGGSYMDIAASGGGIKATVRAVRQATQDQLAEAGLARAREMLEWGTTTVEIKSGYGLSLEAELKMLRAIKAVGNGSAADVVPTFLGAHEIPDEFAGRRGAYVDLVVKEMIPAVAEEGLAEFCDVFCEQGVFTPVEAVRILTSARDHGMRPMIHADEFADSGAAQVAAEVGAVSAAHLAHSASSGLEAMRRAGTVAVLLPGVAVGLARAEFADARRMLGMGLSIALATDFNPGSSMIHSLPIVASLACSFMRLSPAEALFAVTRGGARALGRDHVVGSLSVGKRADMVLFDVPDFRYIPYHMGGARPEMVLK
ncbi:MAG: imidazolonepropionase, partial [bacterium]